MASTSKFLAAAALAGALALTASASRAQPAQHPAEPQAQAPAQPGMPRGMMMNMGQMMPMMRGGMPMTGMGHMMPMMRGGMPMTGMGHMMPMMRGGMPMTGMMGQGAAGGGAEVAPVVPLRGRDLSVDEARRILDGLLAWHGHARLKIGEVNAGEMNSAIADITTKDGSLVVRVRIDLRTGELRFVD
jgi:hypothetical protein